MKINKGVLTGLLAAAGVALSAVENLFPMPVPAVRLGLSNVPVMAAMYLSNAKTAFAVLIIKAFLSPVFSGNFIFRLSIGLPSALAAFMAMYAIMIILGKKISAVSVSVGGAFFYMLVQLAVADIFYIHGIFHSNITGVLLLVATASGMVTGLLTAKIIEHPSVKQIFTAP